MNQGAYLRAALSLAGISRREAAQAACLSNSAFNRKLREEQLSPDEIQNLLRLLKQKEGRT